MNHLVAWTQTLCWTCWTTTVDQPCWGEVSQVGGGKWQVHVEEAFPPPQSSSQADGALVRFWACGFSCWQVLLGRRPPSPSCRPSRNCLCATLGLRSHQIRRKTLLLSSWWQNGGSSEFQNLYGHDEVLPTFSEQQGHRVEEEEEEDVVIVQSQKMGMADHTVMPVTQKETSFHGMLPPKAGEVYHAQEYWNPLERPPGSIAPRTQHCYLASLKGEGPRPLHHPAFAFSAYFEWPHQCSFACENSDSEWFQKADTEIQTQGHHRYLRYCGELISGQVVRPEQVSGGFG